MEGLTMEMLQQIQRQRAQEYQLQQQQQLKNLQRQQRHQEQQQRSAGEEQQGYQRQRQRGTERENREYREYSGGHSSRIANGAARITSGISAIFTIVPQHLWKWLKRFVSPDEIVTFDTPFKISTKYTPAFIVILICFSLTNQFFRNIDIDCVVASDGLAGRGEGSGSSGGMDSELNNYCWNSETFLVAKALETSMRGSVGYPGVSPYDREKDDLVRQKYYKFMWLGLSIIAVISFAPFFIWSFKRMASLVTPLVYVGDWASEDEENSVRATQFLNMIGFSNGVAYFYMFCKFLAFFSPIVNWIYLVGFIGPLYKFYGVNVGIYLIDVNDPWPNPMDAVFPKAAKCEWSKYGFTGEVELKAAQCLLPMNNMAQWSFLFLWWWLVITLIINSVSFAYFLVMLVPPCRNYFYRKYVEQIAHAEVESERKYEIILPTVNGKEIKTLTRSLSEVLKVNIDFGDWLLLKFLEMSLPDYKFRLFIRKLVITRNSALQLVPNELEPPFISTPHLVTRSH